jgi:hypothetical protein
VVNRIAAAAADANHFDLRALVELLNVNDFDGHGVLLKTEGPNTLKDENGTPKGGLKMLALDSARDGRGGPAPVQAT